MRERRYRLPTSRTTRSLLLLAFALVCALRTACAQYSADDPGSFSFDVSEDHGKRRATVRLVDLIFTVELTKDPFGYEAITVTPPSTFRLHDRADVANLLDRLTLQRSAPYHLVATALASVLLPHVDSTQAAVTYLNLGQRADTTHILWLGPMPLPADATDPPAWIGHVADRPVLAVLRERLAKLDAKDYPSTYPLTILAATDAEETFALLKETFGRYPEHRALLMESILHSSLPLAGRPWHFLASDVLPVVASPPLIWPDTYWGILLFYKFAARAGDKRIVGFAAADVEAAGRRFVATLVNDARFEQIMEAELQGSLPVSSRPLDFPTAWWGPTRPFLAVAQRFGGRESADRLATRLAAVEASIGDPATRAQWQRGTGREDFDTAVVQYRRLAAEALDAMRGRAEATFPQN